MNKYTGLIALVALVCASAVAVKAAPSDANNRQGTGNNEAQIGQLDRRLVDKISDQQDLLQMVEKLLNMNYQQRSQDLVERNSGVLSGQAKPPAPAPVQAVAKHVAPPVQAPWWSEFKPQMVYVSGADSYAVVNGKMLSRGQSLGKDVVVEKIEEDSVVLRQGRESHTYLLKK